MPDIAHLLTLPTAAPVLAAPDPVTASVQIILPHDARYPTIAGDSGARRICLAAHRIAITEARSLIRHLSAAIAVVEAEGV